MKVAIVGSGGVGGYFGGRLAAAGHDVVFFARGAHLAAIRQHGLKIESPLGDLHLRLNAASASPRRVAEDLATGPASLLIWASSFTAESARSSRLNALSAACAAVRPSASVAQITVARTRPIMMDLPADLRRVSSEKARKGDGLMALDSACEKVACMASAIQTVRAVPSGGVPAAGFISGGPQAMVRRLP